MIALQSPAFLVLLLPLLVLAAWWTRRDGRMVLARLAQVSVRFAALGLLILALAQPVIRGSVPTAFIFVVDHSASMGADNRLPGWLQNAVKHLPAQTATWQVDFAGAPALLSGTSTEGAATGPVAQTNIAAALRLALGIAPRKAVVVLLSDGVQTQGNAASVAFLAHRRGITIDPVDPAVITANQVDAAITRLSLPSMVHLGDPVPIDMTVRSTVRSDARLLLEVDGHVVTTQKVALVPGDNPYSVNLAASTVGWQDYTAHIELPGDSNPDNNRLTGTVLVGPRSRALVVSTSSTSARPVIALLRQTGFTVKDAAPRSITSAVLKTADTIVLNDLPASAVSAPEVSALDRAVRAGLGMVVLGGPHSLSLGKYSRSPLQRLLPITSAPPSITRPGQLALELVLDRSGSMNNLAGGVPKIEMSQSAADSALGFAHARKDAYGLVSFDIAPHVLVPLQKLTRPQQVARVRRIIANMTADGGTNIYAALKAGITQLQHSHAPYKHVILMTDGVSSGGPYSKLVNRLHRDHITLSTVGMGQDADTALLKQLAKSGHGRYYYTNNANDLPKIFAREVRRSAGPSRVTGSIPVSIAASSPVVRDLSGMPLPHLRGYPATTLKSTAVAALASGGSRHADPVLAQWHFGLGRVLVWTPGLDTSWAGEWLPNQRNASSQGSLDPLEFWDDAFRWAQRRMHRPVLQPFVAIHDGIPQIEVNTALTGGIFENLLHLRGVVASPHNQTAPLIFSQTAPGRYDAALPWRQPGLYRAAIRPQGARSWTKAVLGVPFPPEYDLGSPDRQLLGSLARSTGGRMLTHPAALTDLESGRDVALWWPLVIGALILVLYSITARVLGWSRWA